LRWDELTPPEWHRHRDSKWTPELKTTGSVQPYEKEYFHGVRRLSIRTRHVRDANSASGSTGSIHVEVRDSGQGLDPGRADRLFETFYSTKASGMGVGLAVCRSIIEVHGARCRLARTSRVARCSGSRCRLRERADSPYVAASQRASFYVGYTGLYARSLI
jgi:hypothetical protein